MSAEFTPVQSLVGGLMLASSVHAVLCDLGMVLGVSGFFHETVCSASSGGQAGYEELGRPHHHAAREAVGTASVTADVKQAEQPASPPLQQELKATSDRTAAEVARLFTAGVVLGGVGLGLARASLEAGLHARIFDPLPDSMNFFRTNSLVKALSPLVTSGLLVGFGTKLGGGCTSGHMLCGCSRLSPRSLVATAIFFGVAVVTHLFAHPPGSLAARVSGKVASRAAVALGDSSTPRPLTLALLQLPGILYGLIAPAMARNAAKLDRRRATQQQRDAAHVVAFATGVHFAFGLGLAGMLRPSKVLGFLSLSPHRISSGEWDPSLAMVALGGMVPPMILWATHISRRVTQGTGKPLFDLVAPLWRIPARTAIDWKLVSGAAAFGVGWGLSGFCPGPALANLGASVLPTAAVADNTSLPSFTAYAAFAAAMAVGGVAARVF